MTFDRLFEMYFAVQVAGGELEPEELFETRCKRLAWMARYGRIPPSESARYPTRYYDSIEKAVAQLIDEERPDSTSDS